MPTPLPLKLSEAEEPVATEVYPESSEGHSEEFWPVLDVLYWLQSLDGVKVSESSQDDDGELAIGNESAPK
jgi:hypothetical protein